MISFKASFGGATLSQLAAEIQAKLPGIVKKHAFAIQAESAKNAPIKTGALRSSMEAEPDTDLRWEITDGMDYGVYQELGTGGGVPAKHFLGNACEKQADKFFSDVKEAVKG